MEMSKYSGEYGAKRWQSKGLRKLLLRSYILYGSLVMDMSENPKAQEPETGPGAPEGGKTPRPLTLEDIKASLEQLSKEQRVAGDDRKSEASVPESTQPPASRDKAVFQEQSRRKASSMWPKWLLGIAFGGAVVGGGNYALDYIHDLKQKIESLDKKNVELQTQNNAYKSFSKAFFKLSLSSDSKYSDTAFDNAVKDYMEAMEIYREVDILNKACKGGKREACGAAVKMQNEAKKKDLAARLLADLKELEYKRLVESCVREWEGDVVITEPITLSDIVKRYRIDSMYKLTYEDAIKLLKHVNVRKDNLAVEQYGDGDPLPPGLGLIVP